MCGALALGLANCSMPKPTFVGIGAVSPLRSLQYGRAETGLRLATVLSADVASLGRTSWASPIPELASTAGGGGSNVQAAATPAASFTCPLQGLFLSRFVGEQSPIGFEEDSTLGNFDEANAASLEGMHYDVRARQYKRQLARARPPWHSSRNTS